MRAHLSLALPARQPWHLLFPTSRRADDTAEDDIGRDTGADIVCGLKGPDGKILAGVSAAVREADSATSLARAWAEASHVISDLHHIDVDTHLGPARRWSFDHAVESDGGVVAHRAVLVVWQLASPTTHLLVRSDAALPWPADLVDEVLPLFVSALSVELRHA